MNQIYLFLDDERMPDDVVWIDLPKVDWTIVRNVTEFRKAVLENTLLMVSFDHDLGTAETGATAARFLCEHLAESNSPLPRGCFIHSQNPVGSDNIRSILYSYHKIQRNLK